ncbi:DUF3679 domain-containing protein [Bacillus testis]|uniref:DUF3679 domain-containing protein n=1 Tax=Bacillus testis TaxID=1622072 RepID=UPI00067E7C29|nr:DUF3679 domain-containing protein [Bacillus testis]
MFRFFLTCFCLLLLFFVGVVLGMQKANTGLVNMRGYDDPSLRQAAQIRNEEGVLKPELFGKQVDSHDLEDKKKKLEEMKAFNAFSSLGKKATEGTKELTTRIIDFIVPE